MANEPTIEHKNEGMINPIEPTRIKVPVEWEYIRNNFERGVTNEYERVLPVINALEKLLSRLPGDEDPALKYYFARNEVIEARMQLNQWKNKTDGRE